MYDTGAVIPTALEDGGFVTALEDGGFVTALEDGGFVEGRVVAGVVDAAAGLVGGGSIPTAVAVDGGTSAVGDGRRDDAGPRGVLVAVAELVAGELADTGGLVGGDVATDVTTKPEPVTSTFVAGGPFAGSSVMTGLAARFRDTTGGVGGGVGGAVGGVVVGVLAACTTRANGVRAQSGGVAARQASTWICMMQAWPGMHWPGLIARKLPVSSPTASTEQDDLAAAEPP